MSEQLHDNSRVETRVRRFGRACTRAAGNGPAAKKNHVLLIEEIIV
jgi:hypothetical protein